ncbi:hypothetical protein [Couchioplanes azureus]|uniref:hypothetical protein n=1 Tax=Couchioplanes caeruleus TaxID=56438 RepID=UPI001671228A|nr:hypothetical protein [Couchioplanes caeruleus]
MRRTLLAAALGGLLLTGAGCGSDDTTESAAPAPVAPAASSTAATTTPPPDYSADTKRICDRVDKIFDAALKGFGTELGKMIAYKEADQADNAKAAQQAAGKELKEAAAKVRKETAAAQDPKLEEAGASTATRLAKSATDTKLFDGIKAEKDLDKVLQSAMTNWLSPVAGRCA